LIQEFQIGYSTKPKVLPNFLTHLFFIQKKDVNFKGERKAGCHRVYDEENEKYEGNF